MVTNITSTDNKIIKLIHKLSRRSVREKERLYIAEGVRLIQDAAAANCVHFYVTTEVIESDLPQYIVSEKLFSSISQTQTPQGIMAVCKMPSYTEEDMLKTESHFILVCDQISDPGNLGTMIRTAEAVGVDSVLLTNGTVDAYNPKTVRATMGSIFRMPIIQSDTLIDSLAAKGFQIVVTSLEGSQDLYKNDFKDDIVVVVGSEATGVNPQIQSMATHKIKIPMSGRVESLNAAVAASVILYECKRQRESNL